MSNITIAAIVGSLQKDSLNKKLFSAIKASSPEGVEIKFVDISKLPLFNQDDERGDLPAAVKIFKAEIEAADGVLLITPEHNRSFTAAIKNAIDWGSRPYGSNSWDAKPMAVTGASGGPLGAFGAQTQLRQTLLFANGRIMPAPEMYFGLATEKFDDHGELIDDGVREVVKNFTDAVVNWVRILKK
jgi:chromate reductase